MRAPGRACGRPETPDCVWAEQMTIGWPTESKGARCKKEANFEAPPLALSSRLERLNLGPDRTNKPVTRRECARVSRASKLDPPTGRRAKPETRCTPASDVRLFGQSGGKI